MDRIFRDEKHHLHQNCSTLDMLAQNDGYGFPIWASRLVSGPWLPNRTFTCRKTSPRQQRRNKTKRIEKYGNQQKDIDIKLSKMKSNCGYIESKKTFVFLSKLFENILLTWNRIN